MKKFNKQIILDHKFDFIVCAIIIVGVIVRCACINLYPNALNTDEASAAYEAFSIGNYGIDRNGNSLPVFLIAWGSGQNALYSYLMISSAYSNLLEYSLLSIIDFILL